MTDREIIDCIKQNIVEGETADFLTFVVLDKDTDKRHCFGEEEIDDFIQIMFYYSMAKTVIGVRPVRRDNTHSRWSVLRSYNGNVCPITGYVLVLSQSSDYQTNISPMLMKFLEAIIKKGVIDKLAYPIWRNRIEYGFREFNDGTPIIYIPPEDPWTCFERYLAEGEEASNG